jgi:hypothetical protein
MSQMQGRHDSPGEDPPGKTEEPQVRVEKDSRLAGVQVDGLKIKVDDLRPVEIGESTPKSWIDVRGAVHAKLKNIVVHIVGLVEDVVVGARKFVRGLAEIPAATARRIDRAHDRADRKEGIEQEKFEARQLPTPDSEKVTDQIEDFLNRLRAEGVCVEYRELDYGVPAIVLVRPELRDDAARLAQVALPPPAASGPAGLSIETILPPRIAKVLLGAGIRTAGDLVSRSPEELLAIDGFGERSLVKVRIVVKRLGLRGALLDGG